MASPVSQHEDKGGSSRFHTWLQSLELKDLQESSAELRTELAQLRAKLEDAHGQLRQREHGPEMSPSRADGF